MTTRNAPRPVKPNTSIHATYTPEQPESPAAFPDNSALDLRARFRTSLRRLASTVALVTAAHDAERSGLTATAACSLSVDPPLMLVCVSRRSRTHGFMHKSDSFCINYLGEQHRDLALRFAAQTQDAEDKFANGTWSISPLGNPVLADSLLSIECRVHRRIDEGTHSVFIGTVLDALAHNECEPLVYVQGGFARVARG